jgi:hypothetical protein
VAVAVVSAAADSVGAVALVGAVAMAAASLFAAAGAISAIAGAVTSAHIDRGSDRHIRYARSDLKSGAPVQPGAPFSLPRTETNNDLPYAARRLWADRPGRGSWIRTNDLQYPKLPRYQAALYPDYRQETTSIHA